jgi:uncharacterized cupin superfamily protein
MKPDFDFAQAGTGSLNPVEINGAWLITGVPQSRARELLRSPDGSAVTVEWDCTAGTFHWYFVLEETVHILEGSVSVTDAAGATVTLSAGDVAVFPADKWMVWSVDTYVRKLAFCRYPVPSQFGRVLRFVNNRVGSRRIAHPPRTAMRSSGT